MDTTNLTTARTRPRLLAVVAAVVAALAVWGLARALGVEVNAPAMGDQPAAPVGAWMVATAAATASLAGWELLALLERFTARAAGVWATVAVLAALVSLGAPLTGEGIGTADRAALAALHLVVAGVLVPALYRTSRHRPGA